MNSLQRILNVFTNSKAFIAYLTAGDGGMDHTLASALALIEGGVNVLEIGVPFSDPIADGPIIQRASARALNNGTTLQEILMLTTQIRKQSEIPLILFSYLNPILFSLKSNFLPAAKQAGIDGILIVDCPVEESKHLHQQCMALEIALIYVITPSTSLERIKKINQFGQGFLYYACRKGTTGPRNMLPDDFAEKIKMIKANVNLPVVVGFGISNQAMARQVVEYADGVVIGSLFVKALEEGISPADLTALTRSICPTFTA